jgi:hypothetical protein
MWRAHKTPVYCITLSVLFYSSPRVLTSSIYCHCCVYILSPFVSACKILFCNVAINEQKCLHVTPTSMHSLHTDHNRTQSSVVAQEPSPIVRLLEGFRYIFAAFKFSEV